MLFHAYEFIFLFLPISVAGFYFFIGLKVRAALAWLIFCSLFFYGWWDPTYLPLILGSCCVNYWFGRALMASPSRWLLSLGVGFNVLLLGYFKYAAFVSGALTDFLDGDWHVEDIVLPLGISFFTIQQIAYLIDAKQKRTTRHDLLGYLLFVTFFPQLIAGPIVHQAEMLPQFYRRIITFKRINLAIGLTVFLIGFVKKVVLAESFAEFASPMFNAAAAGETITFLEAWGGSLAYTFQLYFDFSGYSDMAVGIARMFAIRLPMNFDAPLRATSIIEFWQRWHITLTRFVNSYLFNPLALGAARRRTRWSRSTNPAKSLGAFLSILAFPTLLSMFVAGVWHGAGWTYMVFGLLHGAYLVINHAWRNVTHRTKWKKWVPAWVELPLSWSVTFLCVMISFIFFRSQDLDTAWNILSGLVGAEGRVVLTHSYLQVRPLFDFIFDEVSASQMPLPYFAGREQLMWVGIGFSVVLIAPSVQMLMARYRLAPRVQLRKITTRKLYHWRPTPIWGVLAVFAFAVAVLSALQPTEFLYFQF